MRAILAISLIGVLNIGSSAAMSADYSEEELESCKTIAKAAQDYAYSRPMDHCTMTSAMLGECNTESVYDQVLTDCLVMAAKGTVTTEDLNNLLYK